MLLGVFTFVLAVASIPFMLGYAPAFAFQNITVEGLTSIPDHEVLDVVEDQTSKKRFGIFPQNNKFYFQDEIIYDRLQEQYDFTSLEIVVDGRGVHVKAEERIIELVLMANGTHFFLDLEGTLARELNDQEKQQIEARLNETEVPVFEKEVRILQPNMPIISLIRQEELGERTALFESTEVQTIIQLDKKLRTLQIEPILYELQEVGSNSLRIKTRSGFDILISASNTAEEQINGLEVILTQYTDRLGEISYVDLRFGDHVYIK